MMLDGDLLDALEGDALDSYADVHQTLFSSGGIASSIPLVSAFVPAVNSIFEIATGKAATSEGQAKRDAAAAQKKAAAQAAYVPPDVQAARGEAAGMAKAAAKAQADADAAQSVADKATQKATFERDGNGPAHQAASAARAKAKRAHDYATLMAASATGSAEKAGALTPRAGAASVYARRSEGRAVVALARRPRRGRRRRCWTARAARVGADQRAQMMWLATPLATASLPLLLSRGAFSCAPRFVGRVASPSIDVSRRGGGRWRHSLPTDLRVEPPRLLAHFHGVTP
jgi:hypothetical protein